MTLDRKKLGQDIRDHRKACGKTIEKVVAEIGDDRISVKTCVRIEQGDPSVSKEKLGMVIHALGMDPFKYFTDEDIFVERCARNGMSFNQEYKLKYGGENMGIDYRLGSIIEFILEVANERLDEVPSPRVNGELIGYAEALKIIQEQLTDDERKRFKLDFDIDKKYM